MQLSEIKNSVKPVYSFEFFPPKTEKGEENLMETAKSLAQTGPAFFSMTYGAGGSTRDKTIDLAQKIQQATRVDTVCHLTCVSQSKNDIRNVLDEIESLGLANIMALRGDPPQGETNWEPHPDGFHYAYELVQEIRKYKDISVAVAGFPEIHPDAVSREKDLQYLKEKVDCGADAIVTQLFFDNDHYFRFVDDLQKLGVSVPVIPGILPIQSVKQVQKFCHMCKATIPSNLVSKMEACSEDNEAARQLGVEYASEQIAELLKSGAPGFHLYCLNKAESPKQILQNLSLD